MNNYHPSSEHGSSGGKPHEFAHHSNPHMAQSPHMFTSEARKPEKEPQHYWKEILGDTKHQNTSSFFKDSMLQWPIQMLEQQLQFIASSKVDYVGATSSLITDIDFRWLGIRNLKTIYISTLSFLFGILAFIGISLFTKSIVGAYCVLLIILSHSFFPGYITFRMRKFILGEEKTKRFADIVRKSWLTFEMLYILSVAGLYWASSHIQWNDAKLQLLNTLEAHKVIKKLLYRFIEPLPIQHMDFILEHLVNGLLIGGIFYIFMAYFTNAASKKEQRKLKRAVDKEHLRPAEIVRKIMNEES